MAQIFILHGTILSGHVHRVALLLSMLGLPHQIVDAPASVRGTEAFRHLNPLQQVPVLEDGDLVLADSNAILVYLAKRYGQKDTWLPEDALGAAEVQRWLSIAAGELKFGPATARMVTLWGMDGDLPRSKVIAAKLLAVMEAHLTDRHFLAAGRVTIADLSCYSYVAHAPEGGLSLAPYLAVRAWLRRVEALPHFQPMPASPLPADIRG